MGLTVRAILGPLTGPFHFSQQPRQTHKNRANWTGPAFLLLLGACDLIRFVRRLESILLLFIHKKIGEVRLLAMRRTCIVEHKSIG
jgi:hypothetical protein